MKKFVVLFFLCLVMHKVSAETFVVANLNDSGVGSLRRMLEIASDGDNIVFDSSLANKTIELESFISVSSSVTITGGIGLSKITLSGGSSNWKSSTGIIHGSNITLVNFIFTKGLSTIVSGTNVKIINCDFKENTFTACDPTYPHESFESAVIRCGGGSLIIDCMFINNSSYYGFGDKGILIEARGGLTVENCVFDNNNFPRPILYFDGNSENRRLEVSNCTFTNNKNRGSYSANYNSHISGIGYGIICFSSQVLAMGTPVLEAKLLISDCSFENNITINGGAIYFANTSQSAEITNCIFENNQAENGGAIYSDGGIGIKCNSFINNKATNNGGAIFGGCFVFNCTFDSNTATTTGGAITCASSSILKSTFFNNSSGNGGAIYGVTPRNSNTSSIKGNIFVNNKVVPDNILNDVKEAVSRGYNVYTSNQNTIFSESSDYRYANSQNLLNPIDNYGGKTPTKSINTDILNWREVVVRVPLPLCVGINCIEIYKTDQRGFLLPENGFACAGAVEMDYILGSNIAMTENEHFMIYSNPVSDEIHFLLEKECVIQLYDLSGKLIWFQNYEVGDIVINISQHPSGIYILKVENEIVKIVKQ